MLSLRNHIGAQAEAINRLPSGIDSTTEDCADWRGFKEPLWGGGLEFLQQPEAVVRDVVDPVEDIHFLPYPPSVSRSIVWLPETLPNVWGLHGQQPILARSEYNEAEDAAVLSSKSNAKMFLVRGRPGIGSFPSLFTTYET